MVTNVQLANIRKCADWYDAVSRNLRRCSEKILSVKKGLRRKLVAEARFENAFCRVLEELQTECISVASLQTALEDAAACYESAEKDNILLLGEVHSRLPAGSLRAAELARSFDDPGLCDPGAREYPEDIPLRLGEVMALLYVKNMTQEELELLARQILPEMPSKKDHYNRNLMMPAEALPCDTDEARKMGWNNRVAASCHQFTSETRSNQKWISPDGRYEVILDPEGERVIDADEDRGTYNFGDPSKDSMGHFVLDVIPWLIYGNTAADSTTFEQRRDAFIRDGAVDLVSGKVGEVMDQKDQAVRKVKERAETYAEEKITDMKEDYHDAKDILNLYLDCLFQQQDLYWKGAEVL